MAESETVVLDTDDEDWHAARHWAGAFLAGFRSAQTRKSYRRDLHCWFAFCTTHRLHPVHGVRRTQVEPYLRHLEALSRRQPAGPYTGASPRSAPGSAGWKTKT